MDPSKSLFSDLCEGGNILGGMLNSLMDPGMMHPFAGMSGDHLENAWEHMEAHAGYEGLQEHWEAQHAPPGYEDMWNAAHLENAEGLESAWQAKDDLAGSWAEAQSIKESAGSILDVLNTQSDPKFMNSEFYKFIEKLHSGRAKIESNTLIEEEFGDVWSSQKPEEIELWNGLSPEERLRFEEVWNKAKETDEERMIREWGGQWEAARPVEAYEFSQENPYVDIENPYGLALAKANEGNFADAILLLEAELLRNRYHSEAWLFLGKIYSDLDEDPKAILCFKAGHEQDPYNLDHIFSLATASINVFDHSCIADYFSMWLTNNFQYAGLVFPANPSLEVIKQIYITASELNPSDCDVYLGLGTMEFAENNYISAEYYFNLALRLRPMDHEIYNKLGVALMQQSRYHEARDWFLKSLDFKPGYVKGWSNLGRNYAAGGDYRSAVESYLTGAMVHGSEHLFEFVRSALVTMGREDLIDKLQDRNPMSFSDEFEVRVPGSHDF